MLDIITIGDAMIAFEPRSQGPLRFVDTFKRKVGGAEFNVALGCARLGLRVKWISRLGKDEFGRYIYNFARGEGIDVSQVSFAKGYPTSVYFKEVREDGTGESFYYREKSPTLTLKPEDLTEKDFKHAKILHISGVFPAITARNIAVINRAISLAKSQGVKISLDPNIRLKLWNQEQARKTLLTWMEAVDILLTGIDEAEIIFGTKDPKEIVKLTEEYGVSYLFIKRADKGACAWYKNESVELSAVPATKVVDTVGAGDGFDAGALYGILQGWDLKKTVLFANTIGSMVVSVRGDNEGLPYFHEVMERTGKDQKIDR